MGKRGFTNLSDKHTIGRFWSYKKLQFCAIFTAVLANADLKQVINEIMEKWLQNVGG